MRGTNTNVVTNNVNSPIVLTKSVGPKCNVYACDVCEVMYTPDIPTPRRILSMGPPKHAENPMMGAKTATLMLATRSASELPTANMVNPIIASERPKTRPNVYIR